MLKMERYKTNHLQGNRLVHSLPIQPYCVCNFLHNLCAGWSFHEIFYSVVEKKATFVSPEFRLLGNYIFLNS